MAVQVENLLQGPVEVRHALTGATEPANAAAAFGVGWTDVGGTDGGVTATMQQTYSKMYVDQIAMAVDARLQEQVASVAANFAEVTLPNIRRGLNMAADAATKIEFGGEKIVNSSPIYSAVALTGQAPSGDPRIIIVRRTLAGGEIGLAFTKDAKTMIPLSWEAYFISETVRAVVIDDTPGP